MATSAVKVINLALSKLTATPIVSIAPPKTANERYFAGVYPDWRDDELAEHEWRFAINREQLTQTAYTSGDPQPYQYILPNDCLKPLRNAIKGQPRVEWDNRGLYLYSAYPTLQLEYIRRALEGEFTAAFTAVMAARLAYESCDFITQSNTKYQAMFNEYTRKLNMAAASNACIIKPRPVVDDSELSWLSERENPRG